MSGYPRLAQRMCTNSDLAIFRKFAALNAQNLLYLQAELTAREEELRRREKDSSESSEDARRDYAHDWQSLSQDDSCGSQWEIFK